MNFLNEPGARNLLVVDDDLYVLNALARMLRPHFNNIFIAQDIAQAMVILEQRSIDVLVAEMLVPVLGTMELFRDLKCRQPSALTILLTGKRDIALIAQELRSGLIDTLLQKPWIDAQILAAIGFPVEPDQGNSA